MVTSCFVTSYKTKTWGTTDAGTCEMEAILALFNFGPEVCVVRDRRKFATFVKVFIFLGCKIINFAKLTLALGLVARTNEPLKTDMRNFVQR